MQNSCANAVMSVRNRRSLARTIAGCLLLVSAGSAGYQQQPRFGVRVNLVSLDVEVLDPAGSPVLGLAQKDFAVKENDRPMEISNFSWSSDRPVSLAMALDTSALSPEKLRIFKNFILELVHRIAYTDDVCLYSFDARDVYLEQDFTQS